MKKKLLTAFFSLQLILPMSAYAVTPASGIGCAPGMGVFADALCKIMGGGNTETAKGEVAGLFNSLIGFVVNLLVTVAALWFLLQLITAGFQWLSAAGDKNLLQTARNKILNAIEGLVIVVASWILAGFIGGLVGIQILNPGAMLLDSLGVIPSNP